MSRNKKRDDEFFNKSQKYETDYISNQYKNTDGVKNFIKEKGEDGTIHYSTHKEVYGLINKQGFRKK